MKKSLFALVLGTFLMACENTPVVEPAIDDQLAVIKLSPQMLEQIFVSPIVDSCVVDYTDNINILYYGNRLALCNLTAQDSLMADFAETQLDLTGTNPYIVLNNGYAIIDWKWMYYQPLSGTFRYPLFSGSKIVDHKKTQIAYSTNPYYLNGYIANPEYYLLPLKWQELNDLTATWPIDMGQRIEIPEVRYINFRELEKYGNNQTSYSELTHRLSEFNAIYNLYKQDTAEFKAYIKKFDDMQASYVATINQMIDNNEFDNWTK